MPPYCIIQLGIDGFVVPNELSIGHPPGNQLLDVGVKLGVGGFQEGHDWR